MSSWQFRNSHYENKTMPSLWWEYLCQKRWSLYWNEAQVPSWVSLLGLGQPLAILQGHTVSVQAIHTTAWSCLQYGPWVTSSTKSHVEVDSIWLRLQCRQDFLSEDWKVGRRVICQGAGGCEVVAVDGEQTGASRQHCKHRLTRLFFLGLRPIGDGITL